MYNYIKLFKNILLCIIILNYLNGIIVQIRTYHLLIIDDYTYTLSICKKKWV